jgi:trigger factor
MQVTEQKNEGLQREYKVTLEAAEIDQKVEDRLKEIGKNQRIPGFRPGKAPMSILKKRFGQAVMGEVLERAVNDTTQQVMQERGLTPAGQPSIEIESFDQGQDLEYKISMELLPEVEPADFSQVQVDTVKVQVPDSEVDEALNNLAQHQKESQPLEEARPAQHGDVLVVDFKGTVDGETLPGMEAEDHHLELGSNRFVQGFEDQLVGAEQGETRTVTVTFPQEYQNAQLAGKEAQFEVTVKEIREPQPVEIDEAFAQKFGEQDLDSLKERVREQIKKDYENAARQRTKRQLLDKLAELHTFDVPPSLVQSEFDQIWQQIEHDREHGHLDPDDADKSDEQLKQDYWQIAERRVRLGLLLSEIGRRQSIEVGQEELNQALIQEVQRHPGQEREVFEYYQNNQNALQSLRAPIYEDKVIDYILELANTSDREVSTEQLRAELTEEQQGESGGSGEAGEAAETAEDDGKGKKKASGGKSSGGKSAKSSGGKGKSAKAESGDDAASDSTSAEGS